MQVREMKIFLSFFFYDDKKKVKSDGEEEP